MITKKNRQRITDKFVVESNDTKLDVWEYTWVIERFQGRKKTTIAKGVKEFKTPEGVVLEAKEDGTFILNNETYRRIENEK